MTPTEYRDEVSRLAKTNDAKAVDLTKKVDDPWFRAQAYAQLCRHAVSNPLHFAREAAKTAAECKDDYQRSAVRAWEIVALAERGYEKEARKSLEEAVAVARSAIPASSRAESMLLLLHSAFWISKQDGQDVAMILADVCGGSHWREKRARREARRLLSGETPPRGFFW